QRAMLRNIYAAKRACLLGGNAKIIAKMNSLTDEVLVGALIEAARKGVQIDLIVRGACILPLDASGLESRIRVRSIVGRFLEHSRVFYFEINQSKKMWLSSADWMSRNMLRRIEIAWPITSPQMQTRIMQECVAPYLNDTKDAWLLTQEGEYTSSDQSLNQVKVSAQEALIHQYQDK
ncbi:MAG TPA: polyphosphate kinase 1, partial [Methylotenera sp.]|nr:polyphosphate kinase 1 [Methylotenera sp.]